MENSVEQIKQFTTACDNMKNSKFILVNKRISEILKSIALTPAVYNIIAESMINFNFASSYKAATSKKGSFAVPKDKIIAFVFCLLRAIDDGKVNVTELVSNYFLAEDQYSMFCDCTVVALKQKVIERFNKGSVTKVETQKTETTINRDISNRLDFLVNDIKDYLVGLEKFKALVSKEQYLKLVDGFLVAIKNNHTMYYKTFADSLKALNKDKELASRLVVVNDLSNSIKEN